MSWSRWNWLDDGVLPLAIAILRVCWLWPWLALLQRWLVAAYRGALLAPALILGLLLAAAVTARWALRLPSNRARFAAAVIGLALIFGALWWQLYRTQHPVWDLRWLGAWATDMVHWQEWETRGIPPAFFSLLAMAYLWLRGMLDGSHQSIMREQVWGTFAAGFVALALVMLIAQFDQASLPEGTGNLLWIFFATGMAALALAGLKTAGGLENVSGPAGRAIDIRPQFDRYWLGSVLTVSVTLLGVALALSVLIAPQVVAQLLRGVWGVVSQVIIYLWFAISLLLLPVAYLLAFLFAPFVDWLAKFQSQLQAQVNDVFRPGDLPRGSEKAVSILDRVPHDLRWVALAVLIVLIGLTFALALRRLLRAPRKRDVEEVRESILSRDLLQDQLSELWRSLLNRMGRQPKTPFEPFLSLEGEPETRRIIRSVYQALLASAHARGRPRPRSETPIEYRPKLEVEWPTSHEVLGVITDGYVEARYALEPPAAEQAQRVSQAWERLQQVLSPEDGPETEMEI
jgi:hypothetical protein